MKLFGVQIKFRELLMCVIVVMFMPVFILYDLACEIEREWEESKNDRNR